MKHGTNKSGKGRRARRKSRVRASRALIPAAPPQGQAEPSRWRWGVEVLAKFLGAIVGAIIGHWR